MAELLNLSVYNPSSLSDEDFLRGFVARQVVAHKLIDQLGAIGLTGHAAHQLILGQRGMGKTSMLRRLALAVGSDPQLREVLLPLSFREEQYNVHSLEVFWTNCLDALADWYEKSGQPEKAQTLDDEVIALQSKKTQGTEALQLFQKRVAVEGRRPLLLLDNIDLILSGLKQEYERFVEYLRTSGGIVVVGGSASPLEAIGEKEPDVLQLFQVTRLDKLTKEELITCLRSLARARGEEGSKVSKLIEEEPARIRTLHDLTGGNPRTLTLLYLLLEVDAEGDVFNDLERLLDQVTVLYKARVEDLPPQARVVLDAVALAWNPVLASDVQATTNLEITTVSSQLDRLQKEGVVEKVSISRTSKSAYQVAERFFNIWYLMRHGPRRQRTRLRWLTGFLRSFYSPKELLEKAKLLVTETADVDEDLGRMIIALSEAIEDEGWRSLLKNHAREQLEKYAASVGKRLDDIVDPSEVPSPCTAVEWVRHGNLLRTHLKRSKEAEAAYISAVTTEPSNWSAWFNLGTVRLHDLANPMGAAQALKMAVQIRPKDLPSHFSLSMALSDNPATHDEAEQQLRECMKLNKDFYLAPLSLGDLLVQQPGRLKEAESLYKLAGSIAPVKDTTALHAAAYFTAYTAEEFDRAIAMYDRLVRVSPGDYVAQSNLIVLQHYGSEKFGLKSIEPTLLAKHDPYAQSLIGALISLADRRYSEVFNALPAIFESTEDQLFESYRGFVLLLLREAKRQGQGDNLLTWFDVSGAGDRHWPLRAAYDAYLNGEERLLDVNPEVRGAAKQILGHLRTPDLYHNRVPQLPA